ncbi:DNA (cytosine-5-)-methyltransferase [uncultured Draconibacterium sp.]|uniref:DNA (cytosine-5-)-methyltransferase n=1 Tax=uncultured Draconibacterium sp. TaxID=1573823 RepID=UPI002AA65073|nr:DNA (cytosine-5-)-methyltransferase [uncultured Draconibacterium sp.]
MAKYTIVRKKLGLEKVRYFNEEHAYFTHYLQSPDAFALSNYENGILDFIESKGLDIVEEFNYSLPLKYDVPFPPQEDADYKFIDLFAGIGGMRIAHQNAGGKCVFSSEWDKFARITYEANFGEVPFGDITKIDEKFIPDHDVLVAGFPCQPFSIAGVSKKNSLGKKHGFLDETQGTLFFDIARIIEEKRPKAFMLENVKNLRSHDKGKTFKVIKKTLEKLNYNLHVEILDGQHFVPQHRERILIVGFDKELYQGNERFKFPDMPDLKMVFEDILEPSVDPKYTLSDKLWIYLQNYAKKHKEKGNGFGFGLTKMDGISRTISARYYKDGAEILVPQGNGNPRRLTPKECAALQGYNNKKFKIPVSDNQAYKQFGNSVVVPLMEAVAKEIAKTIKNEPN